MFEKLEELKTKYQKIERELSSPEIASNYEEFLKLSTEKTKLEEIVKIYEDFLKIQEDLKQVRELLSEKDANIAQMATEELKKLEVRSEELEDKLKLKLVGFQSDDLKNVILEIRAGTGGEEAALFVADLFKMYSLYAEIKGFKVDILNSSGTSIGGFKEIIFRVSGNGAYSKFKYESGTHRVQRIPETEASGRIHTSAVTCAVLPEAGEVEIEINPADLKIDTFRASGPGGQGVNTTDSAVRITHLPTGLLVSCQDERSQLKNRAKALAILRSRLLEQKEEEERKKRGKQRKIQIGSGDRSEKIRTYNFPQNRVTDHRIGLTLHNLENVLKGNLDPLIEKLAQADQEQKIKNLRR